ncbi:MAG: hypothetical protein U0996_10845 [Planctomycetaceae bacterium]
MMNHPMSLNQASATVDMSPEAILSRLKLVDELNNLCRILGKTSISEKTPELMVAESSTMELNAVGDATRDSARDEHG